MARCGPQPGNAGPPEAGKGTDQIPSRSHQRKAALLELRLLAPKIMRHSVSLIFKPPRLWQFATSEPPEMNIDFAFVGRFLC